MIALEARGNRAVTIHRLHEQYGPVVRIGPKELSFASAEHVQHIYGQNTSMVKAKIYDIFSPATVFNLRDPDKHHERRRLLGPYFSTAALKGSEPMIRVQAARLVEYIEQTSGKSVNALAIFQ